MSVDVLDLGPDPLPDLVLAVALWCLPTVTFVIRRQLHLHSTLRRNLTVVLVILCLGAATYTYRWMSEYEPGARAFRFGIMCGVAAVALAAAALTVLTLRGRKQGGVA